MVILQKIKQTKKNNRKNYVLILRNDFWRMRTRTNTAIRMQNWEVMRTFRQKADRQWPQRDWQLRLVARVTERND